MPDISKVRLDEVEYFIKDKAFRDSVGNLNELLTNKKDNLVNAINEIATTDASHAVKYTSQDLDSDQMKQARDNIGVGSVVADTLIDLKLVTPLYEDDGGAISTADGTILALGGDEPPFIKTINGVGPDEDGNVNVNTTGTSGCVTSVNGMTGDVVIEVNPGSGGVSSWNDLTDKPFYEEIAEVELYRNDSLAFSLLNGEDYMALINESIDIISGETYRINWDGVDYTCVAFDMSTDIVPAVMVGNLAIAGMEDTGEPFLIQRMRDESTDICVMGSYTSESSHSVTIYGSGNAVHTIDEKFIPDSIARKSDVTWENLPDKPFGGSQTIIEWDGDLSYANTIYINDAEYYRVTKTAPTKDELVGVIIEYSNGSIVELDSDSLVEGYGCYLIGDMLVVHRGDATLDGVELNATSPGCYATNIDGLYISKFKYGIVTHIDETYIPDTIARLEDIKKIGLPTVTTDNDGAILQVVNGEWVAVSLTDVSMEGA